MHPPLFFSRRSTAVACDVRIMRSSSYHRGIITLLTETSRSVKTSWKPDNKQVLQASSKRYYYGGRHATSTASVRNLWVHVVSSSGVPPPCMYWNTPAWAIMAPLSMQYLTAKSERRSVLAAVDYLCLSLWKRQIMWENNDTSTEYGWIQLKQLL